MASSGSWFPRGSGGLVRVRRIGYRPVLIRFDGDWIGVIVLQAGSVVLPDLEVTARWAKPARYAATSRYDGFFDRRRRGFGLFVDRGEIERRGSLRVAELLVGKAGVRVDLRPPGEGTIVSFARCNEFPPKINVYIDGRKQYSSENSTTGSASPLAIMSRPVSDGELAQRERIRGAVGELLERIDPGGVEMIEIFRGASELPGEFNDGNCGAIVIWTRMPGGDS